MRSFGVLGVAVAFCLGIAGATLSYATPAAADAMAQSSKAQRPVAVVISRPAKARPAQLLQLKSQAPALARPAGNSGRKPQLDCDGCR